MKKNYLALAIFGNFLLLIGLSFHGKAQDSPVMHQDSNHLYIGSYNVYTLGQHQNSDQAYYTAQVLSKGQFDIVAIQEVMNTSGLEEIKRITTFLKDSFELIYNYIVSEDIGQGKGGQERIGFLYKQTLSPKKIGDSYFMTKSIDGYESSRKFVFTQWECNGSDFDFVLGSGHLYYGKDDDYTLKRRTKELQTVLDQFDNPKKEFGDEDLIFVGDFNRAGLVNAYQNVNYDFKKYFIPNIQFFDEKANTVAQVNKISIKDKGVRDDDPQLISTTIANGNTYTYDMIICSSSLYDNYEIKPEEAIFNENFGVITYDLENGYGYIEYAKKLKEKNDRYLSLKSSFSDHRPAWIQLLKVN